MLLNSDNKIVQVSNTLPRHTQERLLTPLLEVLEPTAKRGAPFRIEQRARIVDQRK